jgi:hypothetical protein
MEASSQIDTDVLISMLDSSLTLANFYLSNFNVDDVIL